MPILPVIRLLSGVASSRSHFLSLNFCAQCWRSLVSHPIRRRLFSSQSPWTQRQQPKPKVKVSSSMVLYAISAGCVMMGVSYAGVPLYKKFCQVTGIGGSTDLARVENSEKVRDMQPVEFRPIKVNFRADTNSTIKWNFRPQQAVVEVVPGETVLIFYKAKNPTDEAVTGIATYQIDPWEAGRHFCKLQCFCFEEQRLNPHEEVDMPVFFYIDPEYADDPRVADINTISLTYTFFQAKEGLVLPLPQFNK